MMNGGAQLRERLEMLGHAIAHVALEAVAGMGQPEPRHQPVAGDLGDDRGRRDRGDEPVAADHRLAIAGNRDAIAAVDEDQARPGRQRAHRARQRPQRSLANVVAIDPGRRRERHRDLGAGADLPIELLARFRGELLGIVEPARNARRIEDDRGGDDRPGERSPPRLVAARDRRDAAVDGAALPAERRTDISFRQRQARRGRTVPTHGPMLPGAIRRGNGRIREPVGWAERCEARRLRGPWWVALRLTHPTADF